MNNIKETKTNSFVNDEIKELRKLDPCSEGLEWVIKQKSLSDAWETCKRGDWMIWYLKRKQLLSKEQSVNIAIQCAERVISIFENKFPDDKRPRKAIDAAKAWLADPSDTNKKAAAAAAAAAYAATYAYAAAAYAAYAAYAADAAAAADARLRERKAQADIIRSIVKNPFKK